MPSLNYHSLVFKKKKKSTKKKKTHLSDSFINEKKYTSQAYITEKNFKSIHHKISKLDLTKSYIRTWIDRARIPYFYEFRGNAYAGYLKPSELIIVYN